MSYQQAKAAIQAGQFEQALTQLELLLQNNPNQAELWHMKAIAWLNLGGWDEAISSAKTLIGFNSQDVRAYRLLAKAHAELNQVDAAIEAYKQAASYYLAEQNTAEAKNCITQIEQLKRPSKSQSQSSPIAPLASIRPSNSIVTSPSTAASGVVEPHQDSMTEIVTANPVTANLVTTNIIQNDLGTALEELNWLIQSDPKDAVALAQRGLVYAKCHDSAAAVRDLSQAIAIAPQNPTVQLHHAEMQLLTGNVEGAIAACSSLLQAAQTDELSLDPLQIYQLRAQAYLQEKQFLAALADYSAAIEQSPSHADFYKARGNLQQSLGELDAALQDYRQAETLYLQQNNNYAYQIVQQEIKAITQQICDRQDEVSRSIRIPILSMENGLPRLEAQLNGQAVVVSLDIHDALTTLPEQLTQQLGIVSQGVKGFRVGDRTLLKTAGRLQSVSLGTAQALDIEVVLASNNRIPAILGKSFIEQFERVQILESEVELVMHKDVMP